MDLAGSLLTIELLQGQLAAQAQQLAARDELIGSLRANHARKAFEAARLKRTLYGRSSERVVPDVGLFLPGLASAPTNDPPASTETPTRTVKEHERKVCTDLLAHRHQRTVRTPSGAAGTVAPKRPGSTLAK